MALYFTSDLHLGHANIIGYCARPFAHVREMDAWLVAAWNATVAPDDEVWVLGDMCMGNVARGLSLVSHLNGTVHLLAGNHDKVFRRTGAALPDWEERYLDAGFASVHHGECVFGIDGVPVRLCHFPYRGDSHPRDRYVEHRPLDDGLPLLHGHSHGRWRLARSARGTAMVDVGVDAWQGRPVAAEELAGLIAAPDDHAPGPPPAWSAADPASGRPS